ncbi:MAG: hypothetical protein LBI20_02465 [Holosporales bacterium]|jgi:hypothetical protein|nr:hypothetical protein [Holosporales bacterium]
MSNFRRVVIGLMFLVGQSLPNVQAANLTQDEWDQVCFNVMAVHNQISKYLADHEGDQVPVESGQLERWRDQVAETQGILARSEGNSTLCATLLPILAQTKSGLERMLAYAWEGKLDWGIFKNIIRPMQDRLFDSTQSFHLPIS